MEPLKVLISDEFDRIMTEFYQFDESVKQELRLRFTVKLNEHILLQQGDLSKEELRSQAEEQIRTIYSKMNFEVMHLYASYNELTEPNLGFLNSKWLRFLADFITEKTY